MINPNEGEGRWDAGLKGKERLFVLRYCTDPDTFLNGTATYRKVYTRHNPITGKEEKLAKEVCQAAASRLLKKTEIRQACRMLLTETQADIDGKSQYQLLHDLVLYATYNPADIINADGTLKTKSLRSLGELAKCVTHIKQTKFGINITLADRGRYITQLLAYLDIVRPKSDDGDTELNVVELVRKSINVDDWNRIAEESAK